MRPQPAVAVYHRLYLKQLEGNRGGRLLEIAPVSFDYQGLIVVDTELLATDDGTVVCQSYSCGCGPQPLIRAGLLERVELSNAPPSLIRSLLSDLSGTLTRDLLNHS